MHLSMHFEIIFLLQSHPFLWTAVIDTALEGPQSCMAVMQMPPDAGVARGAGNEEKLLEEKAFLRGRDG